MFVVGAACVSSSRREGEREREGGLVGEGNSLSPSDNRRHKLIQVSKHSLPLELLVALVIV